MTQSSLAETLRVLRARQDLNITEAAARIGITRETLRDLEHGTRNPYYPTLEKIATAYGVTVEELMLPAAEKESALAGKAEAPTAPPSGLSEEERIAELRYYKNLIGGLNKRWTEEMQQNLARGRCPFAWAIEIFSAAMGICGGLREVESIGGRDDIELDLSREEQQAKLELRETVDEMFAIAERAGQVEKSLEADDEGLPDSVVAAQKRHLSLLRRNIA